MVEKRSHRRSKRIRMGCREDRASWFQLVTQECSSSLEGMARIQDQVHSALQQQSYGEVLSLA